MRCKKFTACLAIVAALLLPACASQSKMPTFKANYYPECYDPIEQMCKAQDNSGKSTGALVGALLGTLAGAAIGAATSRNATGAIVGAAAGAAAGGIAGYGLAHLSQIKDQKQRLAALQQQLGEESQKMDLQQASVESAYRCYKDRIDELKKGVKSGKIKKEEATQRFEEIRAGLDNLKQFWMERSNEMQASLNEYDKFIAQQVQDRRARANQRELVASHKAKEKLRSVDVANAQKNSESDAQLSSALAELDDAIKDANAV